MRKIRILAVDDNVVNLATLEQELKDKYELIPLNSGVRAIKYLRKQRPDLILLDVEMPIMDGIDTLNEIRSMENGTTLPVIFLTTNNDRFTVTEGIKLGIVDYVIKPFKSVELRERIDRALKRCGVLPMENKELYRQLMELQDDLRNNKLEPATIKLKEMTGYKLEESIAGRVKVVREKVETGDIEAANQMLDRIVRLLATKGEISANQAMRSINKIELNSRLRYTINALEHFHTKDAMDKLEQLLYFQMPDDCRQQCTRALGRLREYDDEEAETLLKGAMDMLKQHFIGSEE
jgi:response regulator RpfG family c-di-GMP phosphodiesterase